MISIIVCSKQESQFNAFSLNVSKTIGIDFEIIKFHNPDGIYGISSAYNVGAEKAKFFFLCFIHEDVRFSTIGWGQLLMKHFYNSENVGVLGFAGSVFKTKTISSWWQPEINYYQPKRANYIQNYKFIDRSPEHIFINPLNELRSRVVSIDGLFMGVRRDVWQFQKFDDKLLNGFHGYDLDFSIRIARKYNNYVIYDILLEHLSEGINDKKWFEAMVEVHSRNKNILPIIIDESLSLSLVKKAEKLNFRTNIYSLLSYSISFRSLTFLMLKTIKLSGLYFPSLSILILFFKSFLNKSENA